MADDIDLPDLVSHLQVNLANTARAIAQASRQGSSMGAALGAGLQRTLRDALDDIDVDVDRPNRLAGVLGRVGNAGARAGLSIAGGMARASAAIGAVGPLVAGVASTLANVAPAAGVAVTGLLAVQLASGTLKLAMVGVEDAVSAALDPSKAAEFEEALAKLSPEARQFALAVKDAAPALRQMQQDVQDRVFDGLSEKLRETSTAVLPALRRGLLDTGDTLNLMGRGVLDAARDLGESGTLGRAVGSASRGLRNLSGVPGIVVRALGQIGAAAGPSFERLTAGAADAATGISERLTEAFESGAMQEAIENAIDLLGDLVDVGANVGSILGSIFEAANVSGGGLIGTLETITGALATAFASPEVQAGLSALFETMMVIAETVAPLLVAALGLLGPVLAIIGPPIQELVRVLGEELLGLMPELQPVLTELAGAFVAIVEAVIPLLPPLATIIADLLPLLTFFLRGVAEIITGVVAPALTVLVEGISILVGALTGWAGDTLQNYVIPIIQTFVALLNGDVRTAQETAAGVTRRMVDSQVAAFTGFGQRVYAFAVKFARDLTNGANSAALGFIGRVQRMLSEFAAYINQIPAIARDRLAGLGSTLQAAGVNLIRGFIDGIRSQIPSVQGVLSGLTNSLPDWKGPKSKDAKILTPAGKLLIEGFIKGIDGTTAKLRSRLESITKALPANVKSGYGKQLKAATKELEKLVTQRDGVIKKLAEAEKKLAALRKEGAKAATDITEGILKDASIVQGNSLVNSVSAITVGLQQALAKTKEFQANIEKLKKSGLRSDLLQQIADAGVDGGAATAAALAKATPAELKKINDLQAQLAKSAASTGKTVGDALYTAGIRAAEGLVAGLKSQEAKIQKTMQNIAKGMLTTVKKVHKTHSPSQAFKDVGEMDGEGLRVGLLATVDRVRAAGRVLAGAALDVASGVGGALSVAPSGPQLASVYAGGGGGDTYNTFNLNGSEASPDGILRALSWRGLVGRR
ncbi:hypothetical protein [Streptomyces phaeochromogenes]|uniref:phage tail protein n=1 Tax=Streptomyces phaeochromogenes TaxID=1923 RepID=UPI002DD8B5EA|nr:hypothetical protein [Streptomyces phaeochromogenes]WRZ32201.1 hypothetical protein OG931_32985 [Streptomyces phaeochromogenes]